LRPDNNYKKGELCPSAKSRTKEPRFLRENEASPWKAFSDSKKTTENTRMYLGEKFALAAKNAEKTADIRNRFSSDTHPKTSRHRSLKRNAP
jgi:hypothetical protein